LGALTKKENTFEICFTFDISIKKNGVLQLKFNINSFLLCEGMDIPLKINQSFFFEKR